MAAFPTHSVMLSECGNVLSIVQLPVPDVYCVQTLQRANQVRKVQTTEPWDPEVSTLHRRNLLVL